MNPAWDVAGQSLARQAEPHSLSSSLLRNEENIVRFLMAKQFVPDASFLARPATLHQYWQSEVGRDAAVQLTNRLFRAASVREARR